MTGSEFDFSSVSSGVMISVLISESIWCMEQEFTHNDHVISRANITNWMIYTAENYFSLM